MIICTTSHSEMQGLYVQIGVPRVWQDPMQIGVRTLGRGLRALGRGLRGGLAEANPQRPGPRLQHGWI